MSYLFAFLRHIRHKGALAHISRSGQNEVKFFTKSHFLRFDSNMNNANATPQIIQAHCATEVSRIFQKNSSNCQRWHHFYIVVVLSKLQQSLESSKISISHVSDVILSQKKKGRIEKKNYGSGPKSNDAKSILEQHFNYRANLILEMFMYRFEF